MNVFFQYLLSVVFEERFELINVLICVCVCIYIRVCVYNYSTGPMQLLKFQKNKKADRLGVVISAYNLRTWKTQARDSWAFKDSPDYRVRSYFRGKQYRIRNLAQLEGCCLTCTKLWVELRVVVHAVMSALGR